MKRLKELRKRFGSSLGSLGNETLHPFYSRKHVVQTCKVRKSVPHSDRYVVFPSKYQYFFPVGTCVAMCQNVMNSGFDFNCWNDFCQGDDEDEWWEDLVKKAQVNKRVHLV